MPNTTTDIKSTKHNLKSETINDFPNTGLVSIPPKKNNTPHEMPNFKPFTNLLPLSHFSMLMNVVEMLEKKQ